MILKGHEREAKKILDPYLPKGDPDQYGYKEGGSLYAYGLLIYQNNNLNFNFRLNPFQPWESGGHSIFVRTTDKSNNKCSPPWCMPCFGIGSIGNPQSKCVRAITRNSLPK